MGQGMTTLFLGREASESLPSDRPHCNASSSHHHSSIDTGVNFQASIPCVANISSVGRDGGNSGTPIPVDAGITLDADADPCGGGREDSIVKSLQPSSRRDQARGRLEPYSWKQKILLVGEGDFSFSASLAVAFGDASNMVATSLDSYEFLMKNDKRAISNITELTSRSCKVIHRVNATQMAIHPQLRSLKFDCIVYNFPHSGFANRNGPQEQDAQIRTNEALVKGFLTNAKKMIKRNGQIHITHKSASGLDWNIGKLGSKKGVRLVEEAPFNIQDYPGYEPKFGYGGAETFNWRPSRRYIFQLPNKPKKIITQRKRKN